MSTVTAYDPCACAQCEVVKANRSNGIWWHCGTGDLSDDEFKGLAPGPAPWRIFREPHILNGPDMNPFLIGSKPHHGIFFSRGTWLFDSFCDGHDCKRRWCDESNEKVTNECNTAQPHRVIGIKNPINVLTISTASDLIEFIDRYTTEGPDLETINRKRHIEWLEHDIAWIKSTYQENIGKIRESVTKRGGCIDIVVSWIRMNCIAPEVTKFNFACQFMAQHPEYEQIFGTDEKNLSESQRWEIKIRGQNYGAIQFERTFEYMYTMILVEELKKLPDTLEKKYGMIDWDKVWGNGSGYWGVAFDFRKVRHLGLSANDRRYMWHDGWDVETLVIFDLRAMGSPEDNSVTIEDIVI